MTLLEVDCIFLYSFYSFNFQSLINSTSILSFLFFSFCLSVFLPPSLPPSLLLPFLSSWYWSLNTAKHMLSYPSHYVTLRHQQCQFWHSSGKGWDPNVASISDPEANPALWNFWANQLQTGAPMTPSGSIKLLDWLTELGETLSFLLPVSNKRYFKSYTKQPDEEVHKGKCKRISV